MSALELEPSLTLSLIVVLQSILSISLLYEVGISLFGLVPKGTLRHYGDPKTSFAIVIPAHDEEHTIGQAISSLLATDYPPDMRTIFVVADNCSDSTAEVATHYNAICLRREDPKRGKGQAIHWALQRIPKDNYHALVILDADTVVHPSFLSALDRDLQDGQKVIQAYDGTKNPDESWMTRLSHLSDFLQFECYFKGRSRLGLSCRLLGNGMCFSRQVVENIVWDSPSIAENWEYYMNVTLAGYKVHYSPMARAFAEGAVNFTQGKSQRVRWMRGRADVLKKYLLTLIVRGLRERDFTKIDVAIHSLLPSQSVLCATMLVMLGVQLCVADRVTSHWLAGIIMLEAIYVGVGIVIGKFGATTYAALLFAPAYLVWKLWLRALATVFPEQRWVRTERRNPSHTTQVKQFR